MFKNPQMCIRDSLRTVGDFDETINDFALASIALSLKAISLNPYLLDEYGAADRLLFSAEGKATVWHVGFIGLEGDIEICGKIFRYAVRCIKSEQKKLRKQHRDYYTPQEIAKICDSYGYGFARGVYEAFTRQNEENQEYGLVLKVPEEVKDELEKIGPPKEFKKTPQPKTVGELDAAWRGVEDGRKFDPSNKLEEKKQEA